jgi:cysteine sulfinate desulfinase/cysteine desulfurase-like protein/anaerobic selenocysteine-containing dehydrogenase
LTFSRNTDRSVEAFSMSRAARRKKGICGICPAGCWVIAEYDEQGDISRLLPDEDPDMGITCRLAEHVRDIVYSPDRLRHPLRRKGKKGGYDFERISWDEAFKAIAENLERIKRESGPEAAAIYTGVGSFEQAFCDIYQPASVPVSSASSVLFPFGSPNTMGVGALCYVSYGVMAPHLCTGKLLADMFNDVSRSEMIVVWGANPATDLPPVDMRRILEAARNGAEVVVIDPRRSMTAKLTEARWLPIRPGTDGALALGLCNVLIEEELYDEHFVREWTLGFEDFSRYAQHFTPQWVESVTGVPAGEVVRLARRMASARGVSQYMYTGMEYSNSGLQAIRATLTLWALAGQLDVPGGRCFQMDANRFPISREHLVDSPKGARKLGDETFPLYVAYRDEAHAIALPEAVLQGKPYPVRSLIVLGSSMITSWPDPEVWKETFRALDFMVCIDRHLTADCAYADIVLPAATYFETDSYMVYGPLFRLRERMIEPVGEARSDLYILAELASRLGYGHLYPQGPDELYERILKGSGFTLEDVRSAGGSVSVDGELMQYRKWEKGLLRGDGRPGFDTPSGKFEIHSTVLEDYGYDPLPAYREPAEGPRSSPELAGRFPLVFNSGARVRTSFHTQHHGVPGLIRERPEPTVTINTGDARERGIEQGELVRVSTLRGNVLMRALVTDDIAPGRIEANHACGSPVGPERWSGQNINSLTDLQNYDPISGFPVYKCLLCEVQKSDEAERRVSVDSGEAFEAEPGALRPAAPAREIYLDHNATTPVAPEVQEAMRESLEEYGNPSSIHRAGERARSAVEEARRKVAATVGCTPRRVVFTGSGSEANNLAIKGVALRNRQGRGRFITTGIEHPSVLGAFKWLQRLGFAVTVLQPDARGMIDPVDFERALTPDTVLASVMLANNETGVVQPVREMAEAASRHGVLMHCDAIQGLGKIPVDMHELGVDMLSLSAHKIYGPKGAGALCVRRGVELEELVSGGGQEWSVRSGTENLPGIVGFGKALEAVPSLLSAMPGIRRLRDRLAEGLLALSENGFVNGHPDRRLPNTLNVTLPEYRGESLVMELSQRGVYLSSGSACKAGSPEPSAALLAMGLSESEAHCSLRISLGTANTEEDIEAALQGFREVVTGTRRIVHFAPCR